MDRLTVRESVLCCESCSLHTVGSGPVPFSGPTPAYLAIVGEAPDTEDDKRGEPFCGPAGELLRDAMVGAGLAPATVALMNAVSCFAGRHPTMPEVNACGTNLAAQLEVVDPRWVALLGGVALSTLRPDLKISRTRGHVLVPAERPWKAFVTFHPTYALRYSKGEKILREDLTVLADMMEAEDWLPLSSTNCVGCGLDEEQMAEHDMALRTDDMGATYCSECFTTSPTIKAVVKQEQAVERVQATGVLF